MELLPPFEQLSMRRNLSAHMFKHTLYDNCFYFKMPLERFTSLPILGNDKIKIQDTFPMVWMFLCPSYFCFLNNKIYSS